MKKNVIHSRFELKKNAKNRAVYEYFNEHYLHIYQINQNRELDYIVDLAVLKPESHYELNVPWNWLIASALAIGAFAGFFTHLLFNPDLKTILIISPILFTLLYFIVLALKQFSATYVHKRVFISRYASYPILEVPFDQKNKRKFYEFIASLEKYIAHSIATRRIPEEVLQAGELKTLRRLTTLGVLTTNQYNTAKNRIFRKLDTLNEG